MVKEIYVNDNETFYGNDSIDKDEYFKFILLIKIFIEISIFIGGKHKLEFKNDISMTKFMSLYDIFKT